MFLVIIMMLTAILMIPIDTKDQKVLAVKINLSGTILIISGLILVVFTITTSLYTLNRWKLPYILVTLTVKLIILIAAVYMEKCIAEMLLPPELFKVLRLKALIFALL